MVTVIPMMRRVTALSDKAQTGRAIYRLAERYSGDIRRIAVRYQGRIVPADRLPLPAFYNLVKSLPYRRDPRPVEVIARPSHVFRLAPRLGADCKKRALVLTSYLRARGVPWSRLRLMSVSRRHDGRIHHVFPQMRIAGAWRNLDATYPEYRLFGRKVVTAAEVLTR